MPQGLLHITLGMLRLTGDEGVHEAVGVLDDLKSVLQWYGGQEGLKLRIRGLDTFGQRVLFGRVEPEPSNELFWELISEIRNRVAETGSEVIVTNKFEFEPHLTVCKVSRPVARLRRSKYLPSSLYEGWQEVEFGIQPVDNLQLCVIEQTTRYDGFYRTLNEILLN